MSFFSVLAAVSSLTATAVATSQIVPVTEDSVIIRLNAHLGTRFC